MLPTYGVAIDGVNLTLVSVRSDIAGLPSPANNSFFERLIGQRARLIGTTRYPGSTRGRLHRLGDWSSLPMAHYQIETPISPRQFETDLEDAVPILAPHRDPDRIAALWADARSRRPLEARLEALILALTETDRTCWHAADALREIGPPAASALPVLALLADHPALNPSAYAIRAIGAIGDPAAIGPLVIALGRHEPFRTTYALRALGVFGPSFAADAITRVTVPSGLARWQQLAVTCAVAWARWRVLGEPAQAFQSYAVPSDADASGALLETLWDCPTAVLADVLPTIPHLDALPQRDWVRDLRARLVTRT
jgi:hypothetical protein